MQYRKLGEWDCSAIGLGGMPLSIEDRPSEEQAVGVIHRALELGINHIDTAFAYYLAGGSSADGEEQHNEKLIARALKSYEGDKSRVTVASKVGHYRYLDHKNQPVWGQEGNPRYILETAEKSREALETDSIDLYYYHRPDLNTNYASSLEAMAQLVENGVIKYAGISNVSIEQIDLAKSIIGEKFIAVQNQFSPAHIANEFAVINHCELNGLAYLPWSPLGGFRNPAMYEKDKAFEEIGAELGVSKQQVIIAWELSFGERIIPIPGFRRNVTLEDTIQAVDLRLTSEQVSRLTDAVK